MLCRGRSRSREGVRQAVAGDALSAEGVASVLLTGETGEEALDGVGVPSDHS